MNPGRRSRDLLLNSRPVPGGHPDRTFLGRSNEVPAPGLRAPVAVGITTHRRGRAIAWAPPNQAVLQIPVFARLAETAVHAARRQDLGARRRAGVGDDRDREPRTFALEAPDADVASRPSRIGICRSIRMRSKWCSLASATASAPSAARNGMSPRDSSNAEITIRFTGLSSTTRTRAEP